MKMQGRYLFVHKKYIYIANEIKNCKMKKALFILFFASMAMSCDELLEVGKTVSNMAIPSSADASSALKQALEIGVNNGTGFLGKQDGFLKNAAYQILLPKEVRDIEQKIRQNPVANALAGAFLDKVVTAMNRGAERAMAEAKPIFVNAIRQMTINDALNILTGGNGAATNYLQRTTQNALMASFTPVIANALKAVNINEPWTKVSSAYNMIMGKNIATDLNRYVAENATKALFSQIMKEENNIRANPAKRTSDLLKRAFAYADLKK